MNYISPIDPTVFLSSLDQEFAMKALIDAKSVGLAAMIELPDDSLPLRNIGELQGRRRELHKLAKDIGHDETERFVHISLTDDFAQTRRALEWVQHRNQQHDYNFVPQDGLPIADYTVYSDEEDSQKLWELKAKLNYTGVSIGRFNKECCNPLFNYADPKTHSSVNGEDHEVFQVEDQLTIAAQTGFKGTFYIARVSMPETLDLVKFWRDTMKPDFKIVTEVTWPHLFLNQHDYASLGNLVKIDPPLRSGGVQTDLLKRVTKGEVDIIASGHCPQTLERKQSMTPPSGVPAIPFWPKGIELLMELSADRQLVEEMTFYNARKVFKLDIEPKMIESKYDRSLWNKYGYNPFSKLE